MFRAQNFAARLATREDRWSLLKDFVAEWHTPLKEGDGYSAEEIDTAERRLGLKLPPALREWYQLAGHRKDVVATQNYLVIPKELEVEDGLLEFHSENQGVVRWGVRPADLHLPDPPVYLNDEGLHDEPQALIRENETLSEFVLQMALCKMVVVRCFRSKPLAISTRLDKDAAARVEQADVYLGFPDWHWPNYPVQFYGAEDTLALILEEKWIYLAANTQNAFAQAKELLESK